LKGVWYLGDIVKAALPQQDEWQKDLRYISQVWKLHMRYQDKSKWLDA
jgi:hypothetical protein